ncbi:MAG: hypothetical protein IJN13_00385 [Bacilli bacterium]|nr:hypothetical protein [Bacilli bacterium]
MNKKTFNVKLKVNGELYDSFNFRIEDIDALTSLFNNLKKRQLADENKEFRICDDCGAVITSGYCIDNGMEIYCSDTCLYNNYTDEEYQELYDNGNGDCYWTEWN